MTNEKRKILNGTLRYVFLIIIGTVRSGAGSVDWFLQHLNDRGGDIFSYTNLDSK